MDGVRAADRLGRGLRQAQVAHLAGRHQLPHRPDRLLDRHVGVDAVLVVSSSVTPSSSARWIVAIDSASSPSP
jgi:hypothetical protein